MISNNHKTTNNYMVEYELIDGYAVIDNNFSIVTANESMYKFLGNSTHYSIIDSIHQVDLDDFIDVANSLRQNIKKTMCIRMKRIDNSYRWVLMDIEKKCIPHTDNSEYLELHISDVLAIREANKRLNNALSFYEQKNHNFTATEYTKDTDVLVKYCTDSIDDDIDCQFSIIYLEIDNIELFKKKHTKSEIDKLSDIVEEMILKIIKSRGILCVIDEFKYAMVVRDINVETSLRAFIEHLRTAIAWNFRFIDNGYNISFSIGIGRYPDNGTDFNIIAKKVRKAVSIAREKGGNRYIIYKEAHHGEIE